MDQAEYLGVRAGARTGGVVSVDYFFALRAFRGYPQLPSQQAIGMSHHRRELIKESPDGHG